MKHSVFFVCRPRVKREKPPLYEMEFVIVGHPPKGKDKIKKEIVSMGGKVATKMKTTIMAVISTQEEVDKMSAKIQEAETDQIQVVTDDFLDEAKDFAGRIPDLVIKKSICVWGSDVSMQLYSFIIISIKNNFLRASYFFVPFVIYKILLALLKPLS